MNLSMYMGFSSVVKRQGVEAAAGIAKELGFSSVEILDKADKEGYQHVFDSVAVAADAKKILQNFGLSVSCYSVVVDLVRMEGTVQRNDRAVEEIKHHADIAAALGWPFLHHTLISWLSLPPDAPSFDDAIEPVVDAACEVANYCATLGLTCIYEPQGMYFNGVDGFGRFYREMKARCRNVGVCGDMGNTLCVDEWPAAFFSEFSDEIRHVHLKDFRYWRTLGDGETYDLISRGGSYLKSAMLGCGDVDAAACLDMLRACGYRGAFSLEVAYEEPYSEPIRAASTLLKKHFKKTPPHQK